MKKFRAVVCAAIVAGATGYRVTDLRAQNVSFESSVAPVLKNTCLSCHSETSAAGGLNLNELAVGAVFVNA